MSNLIVHEADSAVVTEADDQVTITFANPGGPLVVLMPLEFANRLRGALHSADAVARMRGILERGGHAVLDQYRAGQEWVVNLEPKVRENFVLGQLEG